MHSKEFDALLTTRLCAATAQLAWVPPHPTLSEYDSPSGSHHHHFEVEPRALPGTLTPCRGAKPESTLAFTQTPSTDLPDKQVTSPPTLLCSLRAGGLAMSEGARRGAAVPRSVGWRRGSDHDRANWPPSSRPGATPRFPAAWPIPRSWPCSPRPEPRRSLLSHPQPCRGSSPGMDLRAAGLRAAV